MIDSAVLGPAVAHLAKDGFIAYPTETVWGLGACADRPRAVARLLAWKGRGKDAPMSVLAPSVDAARDWGCNFQAPALQLAETFWPGPVTLVVACDRSFGAGISGEDGALGLRCSSHPVAHALSVAVGVAGLGPLTSTSLNRSGRPPARNLAEAQALVPDADAADLDAPFLVADSAHDAGGGTPSSVVDCTKVPLDVLRVGAIDAATLEAIWSESQPPPIQPLPMREKR